MHRPSYVPRSGELARVAARSANDTRLKGFVQQLTRLTFATPALRGDAELAAQIAQGARAVPDAGSNLVFGDAVTKADIQAECPPRSKIVGAAGRFVNTIANHYHLVHLHSIPGKSAFAN